MYFIFLLLLLLLVLIRINNVGVKICLNRFFLIFASTEEFALYRERALVKFRHPPLQPKSAAATAAAAPTMTLEAAASSATATMTTTTTCPEIGNLYTILTGYQERLHRVELDHQMLQLQLVLLLLVEMLLLLLQPPAPAAAAAAAL